MNVQCGAPRFGEGLRNGLRPRAGAGIENARTGGTRRSAPVVQALAEAVKQTGPEGIGCNIGYHELTLWMPRQLFPSEDSSLMEIIYYDELQDILSDRYTEVW